MIKPVLIANKRIGPGEKIFIIAEAGVNHNGSLHLAKELVDAAKEAGADAVKFQAFKTEEITTRTAPKARYQKRSAPGSSQFEMLKKLELTERDFGEIYRYCTKKKIIFLATPFDEKSAYFLNDLGICAFKIGSGDMNNMPLLRMIAGYRKPIILSTGMADLGEVSLALKALYLSGNKNVILLHCTSNYPTLPACVNLKAIITMEKEFNVPVGYSDHTNGIEVAIAAAAMGACLIEKHMTLNRKLSGPDHNASLEQEEFKDMVLSIRNVSAAMGDGVKRPQVYEDDIKKIARKSIVAARNIFAGEIISEDMLAMKRPGTGIEPKYLNEFIGKTARMPIAVDSMIKRSWVK